MLWWDYGYQITAMGNRTVIVDNNTHIHSLLFFCPFALLLL